LAANLALRLLQVHLAIAIFASGLHKLQFGDWWAGIALWYPLHPPMEVTPSSIGSSAAIRSSLTILSLAAYLILAWQLAFPAFAWRSRWRPVLLGGALIGWLGCALLYQAPIFGPALCIGCLSYISADEWQRWGAWLRALPGLNQIGAVRPASTKPLVSQATR
jgi:hypothetical protein